MTRVLSIHADYGCRNTGVCCSSGWDVPVEPEVEDDLRRAVATGTLQVGTRDGSGVFRPVSGLPHGARVVFRRDDRGRCVFLEAGERPLCAVHRQLGPGRLASACRDFPRVVILGPRGVSVTLSHYCPTAASLLLRPEGELRIVEDPPAFPSSWPYEGLDARESFSPLLRPGVLMGWEAHERWEEHTVSVLADGRRTPEEALMGLSAQAEAARTWRSFEGSFDAHLAECVGRWPEHDAEPPLSPEACRRAWRLAADCVPAGHPLPAPPPENAPWPGDWGAQARPVRRWLAARAFASWLALQGEGLRTTMHGLHLSLAVLRAEASRDKAQLDEGHFLEAVRRADLLLVHLADPEALARRLSRAEDGSPIPAW